MSDHDEQRRDSGNRNRSDDKSSNSNNLHESSKAEPATNPKMSTSAEERVQAFFQERQISKLFNFLISHLLVDQPDDPIDYLHDLMDRCVLFRSGLVEPPLLFDERHIESMFQSMDPTGSGRISLDGYRTGMTTLGIDSYDENPPESLPGLVDKEFFVKEAKSCLIKMLSGMIKTSNRG